MKVPSLTGKTLGAAISALNARNLTYTEVDIDSTEASGIIVKVDPGEGTSVDVGAMDPRPEAEVIPQAAAAQITPPAVTVETQKATQREIKRTVICREEL